MYRRIPVSTPTGSSLHVPQLTRGCTAHLAAAGTLPAGSSIYWAQPNTPASGAVPLPVEGICSRGTTVLCMAAVLGCWSSIFQALHRLTLEVSHCGFPSRVIIDPAIPRKGHKPLELAQPLHSGS